MSTHNIGFYEEMATNYPSIIIKYHQICTLSVHYENKPKQYSAIFHGCKNDNFQMKNCDNFLIFAQNIDCEYP